MKDKLKLLSYLSTATGVLGSMMVSVGIFEGYYLFVVSALTGAAVLKKIKQYPLMWLNICYFAVNVVGIIYHIILR